MAREIARRPPSVQNSHFRGGSVGVGTAAWILHRLTGVVLVVYLMMHLIVIGQSVRSANAFNQALKFVQYPVFVVLDCALAGVVAYHALNGLRIVSFDLGWGIRQQKSLFYLSLILAIAVFVVCMIAARSLL
jgi:succinate dehydrogenase / fumarate reductase cytochrome b subunit